MLLHGWDITVMKLEHFKLDTIYFWCTIQILCCFLQCSRFRAISVLNDKIILKTCLDFVLNWYNLLLNVRSPRDCLPSSCRLPSSVRACGTCVR